MKLHIKPQATLGWVTTGARRPTAKFVADSRAEPLHAALRAAKSSRLAQPRTVRVSAEAPRTSGRYAELLQGSKDAQEAMSWSVATVIENREASADGSVRTLVLSVADAVIYADGRKVRHVQENRRWLDNYLAPGQFVAVRYRRGGGSLEADSPVESLAVADHLLALASSPYEARSTSASLDAAIIEILVNRNGGGDEATLAELPPGALFHVSDVVGRGFCSLFNSAVGLQSSLEEARPILVVAVGPRGIAPVRAALSWTPVLAHATAHPLSLIYVAGDSPASAPYLVEWDSWRSAGVDVRPIYAAKGGEGLESTLESALFGGDRGLAGVLRGSPDEASVVMSGVPGETAGHLTRRLTQAGVQSERMLFCDFF